MPLFSATITQLKPDMVLEWQEFQQKEAIPMLQKGGVTQRRTFQTVIGPSYEYATLTPLKNLAERDGDAPPVKALGAEGARSYGQRARRFVASQRAFVLRQRTADFESYLKTELMPAHKQLKTGGFNVFQTQFAGDPTFYVATLLSNFAELDKGAAATRAYGQAGAAPRLVPPRRIRYNRCV